MQPTDWTFHEQNPEACQFLSLDGDKTWCMKRFAGEKEVYLNGGCFGGPATLQPVEEVFVAKMLHSRWEYDMHGEPLMSVSNRRKRNLKKALRSQYRGHGKILIKWNGNRPDVYIFDTDEDMTRKLFELKDSSCRYSYYDLIVDDRWYPIQTVGPLYRKPDRWKCPCCYEIGWSGPRGPTGRYKTSKMWNVGRYVRYLRRYQPWRTK